jgi:hypothetical protein
MLTNWVTLLSKEGNDSSHTQEFILITRYTDEDKKILQGDYDL